MLLSKKNSELTDNTWLLLGFIHDAIGRLSQSNNLYELWMNLCRDLRWVLPVERSCIILSEKNQDDYIPVMMVEKGKVLPLAPITCPATILYLNSIQNQRLVKCVQVQSILDKFFADGCHTEFSDWLFAHPDCGFISIPIKSKRRNIGFVLAVLQSSADKEKYPSYISATSIYSQHININYELIQAKMLLEESNRSLELTQKQLEKQLKATQTEHAKVEMMMGEVKKNRQQLQERNSQLVAQEEELRMNSEELQTINSHLEDTHRHLERMLNAEIESKRELQDTQAQLIQAEKMASLGAMTAGIAHEINNPLNFIYGGAQSLELSLNDLSKILDIYELLEQATNEPEREEALSQLASLKDEFDFDQLKGEINGLISDIMQGSDRAIEVIKSLRNFSRLDEHQVKMADLHEGINSTLVILRNKIPEGVSVVRSYKEEESLSVECYPGQINQVFMNIISNAIEALGDSGELRINTARLNDVIEIKIQDDGVGIPEEIKSKIFDPFFTTKDVGKGTGLGLSISYGIIEKHHGRITVESEPGEGTTFIIKLPESQSVFQEEELSHEA